MNKLTVRCRNCGNAWRMQPLDPLNELSNPTYCVYCGASHGCAILPDPDRDYWEVLAAHFNLPLNILHETYRLWDPREYTRFGDFVEALRNGEAT